MGLGIPPLELESNPLKSIILVRRLAGAACFGHVAYPLRRPGSDLRLVQHGTGTAFSARLAKKMRRGRVGEKAWNGKGGVLGEG